MITFILLHDKEAPTHKSFPANTPPLEDWIHNPLFDVSEGLAKKNGYVLSTDLINNDEINDLYGYVSVLSDIGEISNSIDFLEKTRSDTNKNKNIELTGLGGVSKLKDFRFDVVTIPDTDLISLMGKKVSVCFTREDGITYDVYFVGQVKQIQYASYGKYSIVCESLAATGNEAISNDTNVPPVVIGTSEIKKVRLPRIDEKLEYLCPNNVMDVYLKNEDDYYKVSPLNYRITSNILYLTGRYNCLLNSNITNSAIFIPFDNHLYIELIAAVPITGDISFIATVGANTIYIFGKYISQNLFQVSLVYWYAEYRDLWDRIEKISYGGVEYVVVDLSVAKEPVVSETYNFENPDINLSLDYFNYNYHEYLNREASGQEKMLAYNSRKSVEQVLTVDNEKMKVLFALDFGAIVQRGFAGTTKVNHVAGTPVYPDSIYININILHYLKSLNYISENVGNITFDNNILYTYFTTPVSSSALDAGIMSLDFNLPDFEGRLIYAKLVGAIKLKSNPIERFVSARLLLTADDLSSEDFTTNYSNFFLKANNMIGSDSQVFRNNTASASNIIERLQIAKNHAVENYSMVKKEYVDFILGYRSTLNFNTRNQMVIRGMSFSNFIQGERITYDYLKNKDLTISISDDSYTSTRKATFNSDFDFETLPIDHIYGMYIVGNYLFAVCVTSKIYIYSIVDLSLITYKVADDYTPNFGFHKDKRVLCFYGDSGFYPIIFIGETVVIGEKNLPDSSISKLTLSRELSRHVLNYEFVTGVFKIRNDHTIAFYPTIGYTDETQSKTSSIEFTSEGLAIDLSLDAKITDAELYASIFSGTDVTTTPWFTYQFNLNFSLRLFEFYFSYVNRRLYVHTHSSSTSSRLYIFILNSNYSIANVQEILYANDLVNLSMFTLLDGSMVIGTRGDDGVYHVTSPNFLDSIHDIADLKVKNIESVGRQFQIIDQNYYFDIDETMTYVNLRVNKALKSNPVEVVRRLLQLSTFKLDSVSFDYWSGVYGDIQSIVIVEEPTKTSLFSIIDEFAREYGLVVFEDNDGLIHITSINPAFAGSVTSYINDSEIYLEDGIQYEFSNLDYLISSLDVEYNDEKNKIASSELGLEEYFNLAAFFLDYYDEDNIVKALIKFKHIYDSEIAKRFATMNVMFRYRPFRILTIKTILEKKLNIGQWVRINSNHLYDNTSMIYLVIECAIQVPFGSTLGSCIYKLVEYDVEGGAIQEVFDNENDIQEVQLNTEIIQEVL